ncbi:metallophosphoesterase [Sphingobacterium rhinopitheci]|uniref:metallophosphoesterase n=1 Tax=Sphingobacterium rhinopitheci TaxID=2781960 RepID=UPI001F516208|nr:metallophosphoesterase [Sphingobacterium rhinopitheci]MCI0922441.1 metallophosphoesterase [Sphingobacterium rhinopitheci]
MKIQVISDLHQEFGYSELSFDNVDVVVFAGDVNLGIKGLHWIHSRIKDKPVIYVLGNHEYYKSAYPKVLNKLKSLAANTNVHVLEDSFIDIDDIRFHGCTLWTDFSIFGDPIEYGIICQSVMNDYKMIKRDPSYSKLRTIDTYKIHQVSRHWLDMSLMLSDKPKNIVVTHHVNRQQKVDS